MHKNQRLDNYPRRQLHAATMYTGNTCSNSEVQFLKAQMNN